ncbi:hydrogenase formation protein HypD [Clostridia bacterium]|nr:hydrogenase formation protein HypD [Clostridia bacterium]
MKIMEVCGTHTASILKNGLRAMLPAGVQLVSGPGCPVCVTEIQAIDALTAAAFTPNHTVLTFGDMIKVRGAIHSLATAEAAGAHVRMVYSPLEAVGLAQKFRDETFVVAAVGFETTAPIYAVLMEKLVALNIKNVKLLTILKTMPPALEYVRDTVDGFLCPGHVAAIIGAQPFEDLHKPCVIAGFEPEHILAAIYKLVSMSEQKKVFNLYPSVVSGRPQIRATTLIERFFESKDAHWRGIGTLKKSGLYLRSEYAEWDYGSRFSDAGKVEENPKCRCGDVLLGRATPPQCPLFGTLCTPEHAVGACMVSGEGTCANYYTFGGIL